MVLRLWLQKSPTTMWVNPTGVERFYTRNSLCHKAATDSLFGGAPGRRAASNNYFVSAATRKRSKRPKVQEPNLFTFGMVKKKNQKKNEKHSVNIHTFSNRVTTNIIHIGAVLMYKRGRFRYPRSTLRTAIYYVITHNT